MKDLLRVGRFGSPFSSPKEPVGLEFLIRPPLATAPGPGSEMPTVCC